MRTKVNSSELNNAMKMVVKAMDSKVVIPILSDILFDVKGNTVTLTASNGENFVTTHVNVIENDGEQIFSVNGKDILDAFSNLPDTPVTIETEEITMKVSYENGLFKLPISDATEYPTQTAIENGISSTLSEKIVKENLSLCYFATAQDELRPVMNGIYFDFTADGLVMVASDGHKLIKSIIADVMMEKSHSFILPKRPADILMKIMSNASDRDVTITFTEHNAIFTTATFTLSCRLIEGRYPNYNAVIPKDSPYTMNASRLEMVTALNRVVPFSNESQLTRISVTADKMILNTEDYDFSKTAVAQMACTYDGQNINIGFKGVTLVEILKNLSSEKIVMKMSDPSRAALIVPGEQPACYEVTILIMPMLIA